MMKVVEIERGLSATSQAPLFMHKNKIPEEVDNVTSLLLSAVHYITPSRSWTRVFCTISIFLSAPQTSKTLEKSKKEEGGLAILQMHSFYVLI